MTTIPPELERIIAQVRQQNPQLAAMPDEVVAQMILQAMQEQQARPPAGEQDLEKMSARDILYSGQELMKVGRWDEAEQVLLKGAQKAEKENNAEMQCSALNLLARLCLQRGDFPQAMALYQQALALAERIGDRRLMGVIYDEMGTTYRMQGGYP